MPLCIPKHIVDKFKQDLKSGKINFDKLIDMSSTERRKSFESYFGKENTPEINALFESKLMLKFQKRGMIDWIRTVANLKPEVKRDIIARVNRMDTILDPKNNIFLEDLASRRLGVSVTSEEAATISSLAQIVEKNEKVMESNPRRTEYGRPTESEMNYGASVVAFENYLELLKSEKKGALQKALDYVKNPVSFVSDIAGTSKVLKSTLDDSFIGRQGIRLFYLGLTGDVKAGRAWTRTFFKSFDFIFNTLRGKPVLDVLRAEILSDPDYNLMRKAKVATATIEEEFPVSWPSRIPIAGRAFKAAEVAFTGSAYYMRYRTAKNIFDIARKTGVDLTDKNQLESIGKLVNSLTARGDTGSKSQKPGLINNVIWSPKMIKAHLDVLTAHALDKNISSFARKRAAINLLRIASGMAAVLFIASQLLPDDAVEWDPRSANFGKIRIGNTRFDITGGLGAFVVLAARSSLVLTNWVFGTKIDEVKSSITEATSKLADEGFKARTGEDVVYDFFANKLAPAAAVVRDIFRNRTFQDELPTWKTTTRDLFVPIPITTAQELRTGQKDTNVVFAMIAESLGVSVQKYGKHISTWTRQELKDEVKANTHQESGHRKNKETGEITRWKRGQPHKGRKNYLDALKKELDSRSR